MAEITRQTIVARKNEIVAADMDGETVMMNIETGKYYNLGTTGGVIWSLLEQPIPVETLIEDLLAKYEVTRQQCEEDVMDFLNEINKEGLLSVQ